MWAKQLKYKEREREGDKDKQADEQEINNIQIWHRKDYITSENCKSKGAAKYYVASS